jgi:hypothetical protein
MIKMKPPISVDELSKPRVLCETNGLLDSPIMYSQEESELYSDTLKKWGFKLFKYEWLHMPSGKRGISKLWVISKQSALALIDFWNHSDWMYRQVKRR